MMDNNNSKSGDYSQDDIITIDSDSDDEFVARKGSDSEKQEVERDIISIDDEENIKHCDLIWGDAHNNEASTSGLNQVRRPQYDLGSSSSDEDSPPETTKIEVEFVEKLKLNKPVKTSEVRNERAKILPNFLQKTNVPKVNIHPIIQQKKVALVKPAPQTRLLPKPPIAKARPIKTVKPSIYMPVSTKPSKAVPLRKQIRQKIGILPNSGSNFSVNVTPKPNGSAAKKFLQSAKKKAIEATNKSVAQNSRQVLTQRQSKPAVAANIPNTSRMGFLLSETKEKRNDDSKNKVEVVCRDPRLSRSVSVSMSKNPPSATVTSNSTTATVSDGGLSRQLSSSSTTNSLIHQSRNDYLSDLKKNKNHPISINVSEKHKKVKHRDSDYDINDVLQAKRQRRDNQEVAAKVAENKSREETQEKANCADNSKKITEKTVKSAEPAVMNFSRSINSTISLPKPASADYVLLQILNWKVNWMKECQNQKDPPPVSLEPMKCLKKSYDNVNDYINHYMPLLLHETWAQLIDNAQNYRDTLVSVAIMSCELVQTDRAEFAVMVCQVAIPKQKSYPREGDLVCVDLPFWEHETNSEQSRRMKAFAYVSDVTVETLNRRSEIAPNYKVPQGCSLLLKYEIRLKPRHHRLDHNALMKMKSLLYLKPTIRNFEALLSLRQSVLCEDILKPRKISCQIITPSAVKLESDEYNDSQYKAILGSVEAISRPFSVPKLLMIQGPPGTGKTHTLIGMIKKIFVNFAKNPVTPKILVCAPSNGAIDEIGKRLARDRKSFGDRQLRIIRIGQEKNVHPEMQRYLLDTLVESNIRNNIAETRKSVEAKKKVIEDRISALDQEIADHRALNNHEQAKKCEVEMHRMCTELVSWTDDNQIEESAGDMDKKKRRMKQDLLKKADVVLSTLNSCRMSVVEQICNTTRGENAFTCVIIDEASQCTEPEILMPLIYTSISKMILIGDPMQLPATVISKDAARHKFGQSLFERLFTYFGGADSESPILMLDTQYRMHSHICSFPSKHFYGNKLKTASSLSTRTFPLRPYTVFNVIKTQHNRNDPKNIFNEGEAQFVLRLLMAIGDCVGRNTSVGVITPYSGQKKLLEQKVNQLKSQLVISPIINTIDGFQGQEKDIIILSCVRSAEDDSTSIGFLNSLQRINVALTRAKFTLVICVAAKTLQNNELWNSLIDDATKRDCLQNVAWTVKVEQMKQHLKS